MTKTQRTLFLDLYNDQYIMKVIRVVSGQYPDLASLLLRQTMNNIQNVLQHRGAITVEDALGFKEDNENFHSIFQDVCKVADRIRNPTPISLFVAPV